MGRAFPLLAYGQPFLPRVPDCTLREETSLWDIYTDVKQVNCAGNHPVFYCACVASFIQRVVIMSFLRVIHNGVFSTIASSVWS